ncbi:MAG: hypothetical protein E7231_09800 [Cellulosilyticum sp.]|nr:hypothetical protein [Cellulosilyticum sp.]
MELKQLMNHLSDQEKRVAERFVRLIYNGSANTAYQYMFTEAILRTVEAMPNQNELDLDTIFLHYAEISYDWCGRKSLLLGGTTEGIKGASKINSVVNEFIQLHHLNVIEPLSQDYLVDLKKKIKPLSRWVQENVGSESKGICQITSDKLLITDEIRQFICKYIQELRESNEEMAKQFLDKIDGNNLGQGNNFILFEKLVEREWVPKKVDQEIVARYDLSSKQDVELLQTYIKGKGLNYPLSTLSNFYLSLKSKPFTILAGISGTGKSKLVRLFAKAVGADFTLIPVKSDWSDAMDLLGYRDLNQEYHMGKLIEVISRAQEDLDKPYIICLDEMNLARVEYYFSDFLSLIESRRWSEDGRIITDAFTGQDVERYSIPENVYIVGTVNMDETTFQFSKKVLDRANTIELSEVDLNYDFEEEQQGELQVTSLHNEALRSQYLLLKECGAYKEVAREIISWLVEINEYLKPSGLQFAYRVRDEIVFYMLYNEELGLMETEEAFDYQILQKILPRIGGTSERIRKLILNLLGYCLGAPEKIVGMTWASEIEAVDHLIEEAIYPRSARKLLEMLRRFEEDGFTSFWF